MRYNPKTKSVVWSSEGARVIGKDFSVLQNPTVQTADLNGNYLNEYHLPVNLNMQKRKKDHAAMAFSKDYFDKTTQRYTPSKSLCMKMMPKRPRQKAV
jgi:hypothetical protein